MKQRIIFAVAALTAASLAMAQKPKSPKETEALLAIQNAKTADEQVAAVENLLTNFADTEFKGWALARAADAEQSKGDSPKAVVYAERALESDPKNFEVMLMLSGELAGHTREFDLDKDEKLARAEKLSNDAMALVATAPKPSPQITDEQWDGAKKEALSQAHENLGLVAHARKKHDVAVSEYKLSIEGVPDPQPSTMVRLAGAYDDQQKPDEALAVLAKVLAMPNLNPVVKQIAEGEKAKAEKAKAGAK